jgi:hypothetical protein
LTTDADGIRRHRTGPFIPKGALRHAAAGSVPSLIAGRFDGDLARLVPLLDDEIGREHLDNNLDRRIFVPVR